MHDHLTHRRTAYALHVGTNFTQGHYLYFQRLRISKGQGLTAQLDYWTFHI